MLASGNVMKKSTIVGALLLYVFIMYGSTNSRYNYFLYVMVGRSHRMDLLDPSDKKTPAVLAYIIISFVC